MRPEQWETFKRAVRREKMDKVPMALIVDSPWIPGYLGIKHMDYFLDPELWFQSNLKILRDTYDLSVGTDGCYTATIDGAESAMGGPTIMASDGRNVRNLLYTFEGCFDTT